MSIPTPTDGLPPHGDNSVISQEDRTMAMLAHILGVFTGFLGPLIIWLIKKDQSRFVAFHAMQALFFQVAINLVMLVLAVTVVLALAVPLVWVAGIVFGVLGGLAANKGDWYDLPVVGKFARQQIGI